MAYSFGGKKVHDTPFFIPTAQLRNATSAIGSIAPNHGKQRRYIYYMTSGTFFWKYDTWKDVHIRLQTPPIVPNTTSAFTFSDDLGYYGNILDATVNTADIAGLNSNILVGKEIEIIGGTGIGQKRIIQSATNPMILDTGVVTTAGSQSLTDTTKRWRINEWVGYQVRILHGTGAGQIRKVLYNTETILTFNDPAFQKVESWNNAVFSNAAPHAQPSSNAGAQAHYAIEKSVITVDSPWTVTPDSSSSYVIRGEGGIFSIYTASGQNSYVQYYDCLSDVWTVKTSLGGLITTGLGTDWDLQILHRDQVYETGLATSGGARTLTDSTLTMTVGRYDNFEIRIIAGTGIGQKARIVSHTSDTFEIKKPWTIVPDATSEYEVTANSNSMWFSGNANSSIYKYNIDNDNWMSGHESDFGICRNISCQFPGQEAFGVTTGVRNATGITVLNPTPTAGGTGYAIGDTFNITTGGTVGKGKVEAISAGGIVTQVSLYSSGINYTTGAGKVTTNILGTGTGLTVNITSVGVVGRITTATAHNLVVGDQVTFAGCTEALWNAAYTVLATDSATTFDVLTTATASMTASSSQSTTVLVDATKNWTVNEHVGNIVKLDVTGVNPSSQFRRIISNTATTLTVATFTAGTNGTSNYVIMEPEAFGRDRMYDAVSENGEGYATGGSPTTLVDSTKTWFLNQWAGYRIRITGGTGVNSEFAITSNDATTLTYSAPGFTPDTTTKYSIMSSYGQATGAGSTTTIVDTTKNWAVNQWAGKQVVITAGTSARSAVLITSNTATTLTLATAITSTDATTNYTILSIHPRVAGTSLVWLYNHPTADKKGNYLISPRGLSYNTVDFYDITQDKWILHNPIFPYSEIFTTSTNFIYDGGDNLYFTQGQNTFFAQIYKINLSTGMVEGAITSTFLQGTIHIGKYTDIIESADGGKFMYCFVNTSLLMYKALLI